MWYNHYIEVEGTPPSSSRYAVYLHYDIPGVAETLLHISATPGIWAILITLFLVWQKSRCESQNIHLRRHKNYVRFERNETG